MRQEFMAIRQTHEPMRSDWLKSGSALSPHSDWPALILHSDLTN